MYINTFYGILCHMCNSVTNPNTHEAYATIGYIHCAAGGGGRVPNHAFVTYSKISLSYV